jgi:hypothetical protein
MRFHIPNTEYDQWVDDQEEKREQRRKDKAEDKANKKDEEMKGDAKEESEESEEQEDMNAAKLFDAKIHKKANIGEFAGEIVCSI